MSEIEKDSAPELELAALRARNEELEQRLKDTRHAAHVQLVQAGLKAEATRAGMIDLDGLKLIDQTQVALDENGDLQGARDLMAKARRDKPWLFASPNSSSIAATPASLDARTKLATEMTLEEWRAARADLLRRR